MTSFLVVDHEKELEKIRNPNIVDISGALYKLSLN